MHFNYVTMYNKNNFQYSKGTGYSSSSASSIVSSRFRFVPFCFILGGGIRISCSNSLGRCLCAKANGVAFDLTCCWLVWVVSMMQLTRCDIVLSFQKERMDLPFHQAYYISFLNSLASCVFCIHSHVRRCSFKEFVACIYDCAKSLLGNSCIAKTSLSKIGGC
jgi:hypothetical protein